MNLSTINFDGKIGIITGGAQGIGKSIAKQFVEMGGKAIIVDINEETAEACCKELGNAEYYIVDLADSKSTRTLFEKICEEQKHIDVLINNAGIVNASEFGKLTLEEWDRVLAIDLTAVFVTCQVLFDHMKANGGGRIVNIASIAGKVGGGYLGTAAYAAAKAGVISLTKSVAKDGSSSNIYCNSVCPGNTKTPLIAKNMTPEKHERMMSMIPLSRGADPDEVANTVLFLASDAASYIQGENIICDGGVLMNG